MIGRRRPASFNAPKNNVLTYRGVNAVAESFFAALKKELVHRTVFPTRVKAEAAVANYIEIFYNHQRPHQAIEYQTPAGMRTAYTTNNQAA